MKLDIDTPLDSYSLAAMARTEDILGFLVEDLNVVGSKDAFKNILYGVRLIVEGKNRRLSDFSEIINEDDDENIDQNDKSTDSFKINVFRENLIEEIISIIRISFGKGLYGTPVWSPRGDLIAFTKLHKGKFYIGVMRTDGSGERLLTENYYQET